MIRFLNIPDAHCIVLERFGKYSRTLRAGLKFYIMGLERIKRLDIEGSNWGDVANKESFLIELAEQVTGTRGSKAYTKDNVEISVDASIFWQIMDPRKAVYESDCLPEAIRDRAVGVLRASIGVFDFDELSTKREQLSVDTTAALVESGKKWGVRFTRIEIQQLVTDGKTQEALLQQVEADRRKKAIIAEAEGTAHQTRLLAEARKLESLAAAQAEEQVQVLEARGRRDAMTLESEGRANQIVNVARAQAEALDLTKNAEKEYLQEMASIVGPTEAARLLLAQKYIEGFEIISKNPSNKVFLPNNFNAAFTFSTETAPNGERPPSPRPPGDGLPPRTRRIRSEIRENDARKIEAEQPSIEQSDEPIRRIDDEFTSTETEAPAPSPTERETTLPEVAGVDSIRRPPKTEPPTTLAPDDFPPTDLAVSSPEVDDADEDATSLPSDSADPPSEESSAGKV